MSLGPRTAGQLMRLGVRTVGQLLAAKPQAIALRLKDARFSAETIADWQREAQLVLDVPTLSTEAARLLAAAGFSSAERIARATPTELMSHVEQLAECPERVGWVAQLAPPTIAEVIAWIQCAQQSLASRAA